MPANTLTHYVFVDFENVPEVNLGLIEGKPVQVTLLIGKNQKKLDLALVQQIRRLASQVELIEVGASGHNALDLPLAYYLGQAVQRCPDAHFHIVSKDKDLRQILTPCIHMYDPATDEVIDDALNRFEDVLKDCA